MKITEPSGRRPPGHRRARRLGGSLAAGAVVAGILVAWEDLHNHAALAAAAAAPAPNGVHETVGSILATGGIFTFLVVAAVVFAVATVRARRRAARAGAGWQAEPARRGRVSARW
jgi:heme/copper-type cytochrome/quinol oxidase subunit 2